MNFAITTRRSVSASSALAASVSLALSGCVSTLQNGPDRLYSEQDEVAQLRPALAAPDVLGPCEKSSRNKYVLSRMFAIDVLYNRYFTNLTKERQLGTLASDVATLGLGAATAVLPGASVKAVLGATTTAVAGLRSDVDKDVLLEQTVQILQNQMEVSRDAIRKRIVASKKQECDQYTLAEGLSDLEDYYRAGTLAGALEAVSATVGNNAQKQKSLKNGVTSGGQAVSGLKQGTTGSGATVQGLSNTE